VVPTEPLSYDNWAFGFGGQLNNSYFLTSQRLFEIKGNITSRKFPIINSNIISKSDQSNYLSAEKTTSKMSISNNLLKFVILSNYLLFFLRLWNMCFVKRCAFFPFTVFSKIELNWESWCSKFEKKQEMFLRINTAWNLIH